MAASPFLLQDVIRIPADVLEELTPEQICLAPTIATRTQARASSNTGEARVLRVLEWCSFYCTFNTFVTSEFTCKPSHGLCRHSMETRHSIYGHSMDPLNFTDPRDFRSVLICCWRSSEQSSSPVIRCCSMLHTLVLRDPRCFLLYKECTCETL